VKKILIAGGGTGGHLYPGIAVAAEAKKEGIEVLFVGTARGIETRVVPKEGFNLKLINAGRFKGMGASQKIKTLYSIPAGAAEAARVISAFGPDAVLGVGGYASFPAVLAAKIMGKPVILQEQNAVPGLANKFLGKIADRICLGFQAARSFFPERKCVLTGNPIRLGLLGIKREDALRALGLEQERITLLITGGSGGATKINKAAADALLGLTDMKYKLQFIHQTGERDYEETAAAYEKSGFASRVMPYIYDMAQAYACADLVICRSGALTIAEVTALGKPAVLIPYPFATDNHQEVNARELEDAGAAIVMLDREATGERIAGLVKGLFLNMESLLTMEERSKALGRPQAAAEVLKICKEAAAA
jgi:UDP-N-acetylglucosamine--N-acetylmuramyl-(pentapeptide) pyrophosphoryl-undecaprenol N-acetylglucosamine transferase